MSSLSLRDLFEPRGVSRRRDEYSILLASYLWATDVYWAMRFNKLVPRKLLEHLPLVFLAPIPSSSTVLTLTL